MPRQANYIRPIYLSLQVLKEARIDSFPVNLRKILRHYNIRLMTYDEYCETNECSLDVCIEHFGKDGATIEDNGMYVIVYNSQQSAKNRIRFTLAHELGHIFHRHHEELGVGVLQRLWVEKSLYDVMEDEANCFARNLLCPAAAVRVVLRYHGFVHCEFDKAQNRNVWLKVSSRPGLPANLTDFFLVQQSFQVTSAAAKTRCHFLKEDLRGMPVRQAEDLVKNATFTAQWRCRKCGALRMENFDYCYHCGTKNRFSLVSMKMPSPMPLMLRYRDNRFSSCPVCGNGDLLPDAFYCHICGSAVTNPCISWRVRDHSIEHLLDLVGNGSVHLNPPGSRYCLTCGSPTLHGAQQPALYDFLLRRGYHPSEIDVDEQGGLPSVKYGPNIPSIYHDEEYRTQKCPKCLNEDNDADADFCIMCGTSLNNVCDGEESDYDGRIYRHSNPANARFCRLCGKPTAYSRLPILPPYQEQLKLDSQREALRRELTKMDIDEDVFWNMNGIKQHSAPQQPEDHTFDDDDDEFPF